MSETNTEPANVEVAEVTNYLADLPEDAILEGATITSTPEGYEIHEDVLLAYKDVRTLEHTGDVADNTITIRDPNSVYLDDLDRHRIARHQGNPNPGTDPTPTDDVPVSDPSIPDPGIITAPITNESGTVDPDASIANPDAAITSQATIGDPDANLTSGGATNIGTSIQAPVTSLPDIGMPEPAPPLVDGEVTEPVTEPVFSENLTKDGNTATISPQAYPPEATV